MNFSADIIVIGGGWAGFAAALESVKLGHSVILVEKSTGASFLSSGAIDVADSSEVSLEKNLQSIIQHEKNHPYTTLSRQMGAGSFFDFLRESLRETTQALPMSWVGDLEKNRLQIGSFGNLKASALVPQNMEDANLLSMNQAKLLVVGVHGFPNFRSEFVKNSLLDFQAEQAVPYLQFVGNLDLDFPKLEGKSSLTDFEIAHNFDQENAFVPFTQNLLSYLQGKVYTHVLFPPLLGLVNTELILRTLKRITGLKIAETLGSPIVVPGLRLRKAIQMACESRGIQVLKGEVKTVIQEDAHVQALELESNHNIIRLQAKAYILASGKYLGTGIQAGPRLKENVFDAELNCPEEKKSSQLSDADFRNSQDLWKVGVRWNDLFQPFMKSEGKNFQNVFAAGSVLSGYDYIQGRCGAGVAICTGVFAGKNASFWIKQRP